MPSSPLAALRVALLAGLAIPPLHAAASPDGGAPPSVADCPAVPTQPVVLPGLRRALLTKREGPPVTIVALGSSSTAGAGASTPAAAYPARLEAALRAALPDAPGLRVVNRGVNGQDATEMAARLESDVLPERPALVIWQVGANGAMRRADPERFRAVVAAGVARLQAAGAEVLLMGNQRAPMIEDEPGHGRFDAALTDLAAALPGVELFSRRRLMEAWAAAGTPSAAMLTGDRLHHNDRGYACLAAALAESLLANLR
jgi:acyl-CoA thioesterase I